MGLRRLVHGERAQVDTGAVRREVSLADSMGDGTPDFLRLEDEYDREAFRRWFTFIAEVQYFARPEQRPSELDDCAALIRYAYREALRLHDSAWATASHLPLIPSFDSVRKFSFPHTPLGPALFRLRAGRFVESDLRNGTFGQFANAETLERFNTFFISRNVAAARPGDLLFFRRPSRHLPFHTMIFIGESQIAPNSGSFVVYHTGPDAASAGEIRRPSMTDLLHYPDPQWRPVASNPAFLGVFRWNILRMDS